MGGGGSALRKNSTPVVQRQPCETQTSYKIRVKFQTEKAQRSPWYEEIAGVFGEATYSVEEAIRLFHDKLNTNVTIPLLKTYYGVQESALSLKQLAHIYSDLSYNPSIGAIYAALLKDRETMNEQVWSEFLLDFQGYSEGMIAVVEEEVVRYSPQKSLPKTAAAFSEFLLGPANSAFHPGLNALQRFDRPISEYFVCVGKIPDVEDCKTPDEAIEKLMGTIARGARVIELECSGGAADGEPRCMGDIYPVGTNVDELPTLQSALRRMIKAIEETYDPAVARDSVCASTGNNIRCMPMILVLTVDADCDEATQDRAADVVCEVLGKRIDCPKPNADGTIWSPLQLDGKVLVVSPRTVLPEAIEESLPISEPIIPAEALKQLSPKLIAIAHMRMVTVYEIRPILDQAKSRSELRKLLQDVVLTLTSAELCAHIMELSSITDMLLVHVQTKKRRMLREKQGNLKNASVEYDGSLDQDTRHIVQFSELRPTDMVELVLAKTSTIVMEERQEEVEPLRGWRYGAQMVPVDVGTRSEASLQSMSLFKQQNNHGFVPRLPRTLFNNFPGFVDLYQDFPVEYARSLFVTVLSGCRIPRALGVTQPCVRVYCNNGTGLKQVAITSTVEDNGYNCVWEEDFEFKFHVNDLNAAACMLFVVNDRDQEKDAELAFASVPVWGLQTGYRSLRLFDMQGNSIKNAVLFAHFDWEPEE